MAPKSSRKTLKYGDQPMRTITSEVVKKLGGAATKSQVEDYLKSNYQNYKDNTDSNLRAHSVNCNRSHWSFNKTARRSDDITHRHHECDKLYKQGNTYEIYEPAKHGVWELYEDSNGKWCVRKVEEPGTAQIFQKAFEAEIAEVAQLTPSERKMLLASANTTPAVKEITTKYFVRNACVVVEVLQRALGKCEKCERDAPFIRAANNTPYLEVHHIKPLSEGGLDTVENAIALCPNCHRQAHFG
ncbi:HNH endonuclease [Klebsiella sp. R445]